MALAEEAWRLDPTSASGNLYQSALIYGIHEDLRQASKSYAQLASETRRGLSPDKLITWTMSEGDPADAEAIQKHPNFAKLVAHRLDVHERFPRSPSSEEWAFFQSTSPETAAEIARAYERLPIPQEHRAIASRVAQYSAASVLDEYWTACMLGNQEDGNALLIAGRQRGLDLPE